MDGLVIRVRVWVGGTLAMEMVCCSMASWMATRSSSLIWARQREEFGCNPATWTTFGWRTKKRKDSHLIKLVDADHSAVGQHHGSALHDEAAGVGVSQHRGRQTSCTAALARGVHLKTHHHVSIKHRLSRDRCAEWSSDTRRRYLTLTLYFVKFTFLRNNLKIVTLMWKLLHYFMKVSRYNVIVFTWFRERFKFLCDHLQVILWNYHVISWWLSFYFKKASL